MSMSILNLYGGALSRSISNALGTLVPREEKPSLNYA